MLTESQNCLKRPPSSARLTFVGSYLTLTLLVLNAHAQKSIVQSIIDQKKVTAPAQILAALPLIEIKYGKP